MAIRILLADDHEVVRHGLRTLLELQSDLVVVGEAADGSEAAELACKLRPDVVLMDLVMPGADGLSATRRIREQVPDTEVVAFTSVLESTSVVSAARAGAIAYLLKDTNAGDLTRAIAAAAAGQVLLTPKLAAHLIREVPLPHDAIGLDEAEEGILRMIAEGRTNEEMAHAAGVDGSVIRAHVNGVLRKLGLKSRTQAALYAAKVGLVALDQFGARADGESDRLNGHLRGAAAT